MVIFCALIRQTFSKSDRITLFIIHVTLICIYTTFVNLQNVLILRSILIETRSRVMALIVLFV